MAEAVGKEPDPPVPFFVYEMLHQTICSTVVVVHDERIVVRRKDIVDQNLRNAAVLEFTHGFRRRERREHHAFDAVLHERFVEHVVVPAVRREDDVVSVLTSLLQSSVKHRSEKRMSERRVVLVQKTEADDARFLAGEGASQGMRPIVVFLCYPLDKFFCRIFHQRGVCKCPGCGRFGNLRKRGDVFKFHGNFPVVKFFC